MCFLAEHVSGFTKAASLTTFVLALNAECLFSTMPSVVTGLVAADGWSCLIPGQVRWEHKGDAKIWKQAYVEELSSPLLVLGCCWNGEQEGEEGLAEQGMMNARVLTWGCSCPCTTANGSILRARTLLPDPRHLRSASGSSSGSFKRKCKRIPLTISHGCSVLQEYFVSTPCCPSSGVAHRLQTLPLPCENAAECV